MKFERNLRLGVPVVGAAALLAACSSVSLRDPAPVESRPVPSAPEVAAPSPVPAPTPAAPRMSAATSDRAYRQDAAGHIYGLHQERIWKGRLPPMLYAIGVLEVDVDRQGYVRNLSWLRAPRHAPEVIAEIEKTVREAAPYPAPVRMGKAKWVDTWLWHSSGRFQLDTLTEGQD